MPISPHASDKARQGRTKKRPEAAYVDIPSPKEEKRLNFMVVKLFEDAEKVMNLEGSDEAQKWVSIGRLMKRIQNTFPYLINEDTILKLPHKKKVGNLTIEVEGPLTYSLFMSDLKSETKMGMYHKDIVAHHGTVGSGDNRRETLRAEDMLLMLYTALRYELQDHENFEALFVDDEEPEATAESVGLMPHFGLFDSDSMQEHWVDVYHRLIKNGWLYSYEVSSAEWVYICCGKRTQPKGFVVWHGTTAALAYIVRTKLGSKWHLAHQIFCRPEGEKLPVSFNTTKNPAQKVIKEIEEAFSI